MKPWVPGPAGPLVGEVELSIRLDLDDGMRGQLLALIPSPDGAAPFVDVTLRHVKVQLGNGNASTEDGLVMDMFVTGDDATKIEFTVSTPPERPAGLRGDTA